MTGPCPHCGSTITSPGPEEEKAAAAQQVSAKVEVPAVVVKEKVEVPAEPARPPAGPPPLPSRPAPAAEAPPVEPVKAPAPVEAKISPEPAKAPAEPVKAAVPVEPPPVKAPPPPPPAEPVKAAVPVEPPPVKAPPPPPPAEPVKAAAPVEPPPVKAPPPPPPAEPVKAAVPVEPPPVKAPPSSPPAEPVKADVPVEPAPKPAPPQPVEPARISPAIPVEPAKAPAPVQARMPEEAVKPPAEPVKAAAPAVPVEPVRVPPAEPVKAVEIGLRQEDPFHVQAPPPAEPVQTPAPAAPVEPVKAAEEPPRQQAPAAMPAPVKISIGLSDEALESIRPPAPAPAPEPARPAPAPAPKAAAPAIPAAPEVPPPAPAAEKPRRGILAPLLVLLALMAAGGAAVFYYSGKVGRGNASAPPVNPAVQAKIRESEYLRGGWQEEARQVLAAFLAADTPAGKAAYSIRGSELLPRMQEFYGDGPIDDSDTPVSGFAAGKLTEEDHQRGIFRMTYDLPPQFEMREFFRPIAPLEVQLGVEEPDLLLSSLARASNFSMEPVMVEAFFKRQPDGLKIDWETFVQTKYRTFRDFTELPDPGASGIFRLFAVEDVPEKGRASQGTKTYRLVDPAYRTDFVRVEVAVDSELGRALSILNWRGVEGARPVTKTVTLELEWTREASPRVAIKRFICWEFLGIGGEAAGSPGK